MIEFLFLFWLLLMINHGIFGKRHIPDAKPEQKCRGLGDTLTRLL